MVKVSIFLESLPTNEAVFSTLIEAQSWYNSHIVSFPDQHSVVYYEDYLPSEEPSTPRQFLASTDWKIIRHYDQTLAGVITSLSQDELLLLLAQRQAARDAI
jgi:hypothetical protein